MENVKRVSILGMGRIWGAILVAGFCLTSLSGSNGFARDQPGEMEEVTMSFADEQKAAKADALQGFANPYADFDGPVVMNSEEVPWKGLSDSSGRNWERLAREKPDYIRDFSRVFQMRVTFRTPDLMMAQAIFGPGAVYPTHSHATPEFYYVIAGEALWEVDGEQFTAGPGATIYLKPYADHRLVVTSDEPYRVLMGQWAPGGDRSFFGRDYFLTEDVVRQPEAAFLPDELAFHE